MKYARPTITDNSGLQTHAPMMVSHAEAAKVMSKNDNAPPILTCPELASFKSAMISFTLVHAGTCKSPLVM